MKQAYITHKTLQSARDAKKISAKDLEYIESVGRSGRNSARYKRILDKVRAWLAACAAKAAPRQSDVGPQNTATQSSAASSNADRVARHVAKHNEIGAIPRPRHPRVVERCRDGCTAAYFSTTSRPLRFARG